jgi:hypothetical protein
VFESSHPLAFLDYFRIPYQVRPPGQAGPVPVPVHRLRPVNPGGAQGELLWLAADTGRGAHPWAARLGRYQLGSLTFFGHVLPDAGVPALLGGLGGPGEPDGGWRRAEPIRDPDGRPVAAIWRDQAGRVFLPFDPDEVMRQFWSEEYQKIGRTALTGAGYAALRRGYYRVRPALPREFQLYLRRRLAAVQGRASFPRWPIEDSLHDLYAWLAATMAELAGQPVPFLDVWPGGRTCALVLTHDVETEAGYRDMELLRGPERDLGYRSSWNFVALRYQVDDATVGRLHDEDCEVGVHGLRHDGFDLASARRLAERLPAIREAARRWDAVGFRSPGTQRRWELMPRLGFAYDSSYSDTDPYEPQPGGCCTYLPFFNDGMVELPITIPQDHTIYSILQAQHPDIWLDKAKLLRERHAMVLVLTHPDYAGDPAVAEGYRELLDQFHGDDSVWHALPREVAAWWRDRAASTIRWHDGGWAIEGPAAASAVVRYATRDGLYGGHR